MDPETQRLWNEWADRRIAAALEAERAHFEQRLRELEVKILDLVSEAFTASTAATTEFIQRVVEEGITKSVKTAERLLTEFHSQVQHTLERRLDEPGSRESKTIN
jgi:hypothetical protein